MPKKPASVATTTSSKAKSKSGGAALLPRLGEAASKAPTPGGGTNVPVVPNLFPKNAGVAQKARHGVKTLTPLSFGFGGIKRNDVPSAPGSDSDAPGEQDSFASASKKRKTSQ